MSAPKKIYLSKLVMAGAEILDKPVSDDDVEYIRADVIRNEIERLKEDVPCRYHPYSCASVLEAYEELLSFLSTLESEKPVTNDLEEAAKEKYPFATTPPHDAKASGWYNAAQVELQKAFIAGAKWQKQHDAELIEIAYNDGITIGMTKQKEQMMKKDYPKWRRIKAGERLPCPAYVWPIAYENYPDCFEGRLMPNIQGVKVGRDTWYLPVDVIHNLPKED